MSEERRDESKQTHGTGEQYVLTPQGKKEKQKVKPQDELPQKVLTEDGALVDLDTGSVNRSPRVTNLCGRNVDLSEFGPKGEGFVQELYEGWLGAVQSAMVSTFCPMDEGYVNSLNILDYLTMSQRSMISNFVSWRYSGEGNEIGPKVQKGYFLWDEQTTFEQWMVLTSATLKWRLKEEIDRRMIMQGLTSEEVRGAKHLVEECLIVVEKWLALPESKQLISV